MFKLDQSYSDYVDTSDPVNYPGGKAVDCSTPDSIDGTPITKKLLNHFLGAHQAIVKAAFGNLNNISGAPDSATDSDVLKAIQKMDNDIVTASASRDEAMETDIIALKAVVPTQASAQNQLTTKNFVNSSIQTSTADFRGSWARWSNVPNDINDYQQDEAGNKTPNKNDYMYVRNASDYGEAYDGTWRFKYTGVWETDGKNGWQPEYQLNQTVMTAEQIEAINSGITYAMVQSLRNLVFNAMNTPVASCTTAADELNKEISLGDGVELAVGMHVNVIFENGHTVVGNKFYDDEETVPGNIVSSNNPTLSLNGSTAYPITIGRKKVAENFVLPGEMHELVFLGDRWDDKDALNFYAGSNDNGNYVKHRDGKIEQWKKWNTPPSETVWNFPVPFSDAGYLILSSHNSLNNGSEGSPQWRHFSLKNITKERLTLQRQNSWGLLAMKVEGC